MNKIEKMIKWFQDRKGKVTYSMEERTGTESYDCSSSVYYAICEALGLSVSYPTSTETMHEFLLKNGFEKIADNTEWKSKRGDIFILGRKGRSAGAGGHTGVYLNESTIIHCNFGANGISVDSDSVLDWDSYGWYGYRLKEESKWIKNSVGWWYLNSDGSYPKNTWKKIDDDWFYFDENGYALQNRWFKYKGEWYYFDDGCYMLSNQFVTIGSETFYLNRWGVCDLNYVREIDGKMYAFNYRGALIKDKTISKDGVIL